MYIMTLENLMQTLSDTVMIKISFTITDKGQSETGIIYMGTVEDLHSWNGFADYKDKKPYYITINKRRELEIYI